MRDDLREPPWCLNYAVSASEVPKNGHNWDSRRFFLPFMPVVLEIHWFNRNIDGRRRFCDLKCKTTDEFRSTSPFQCSLSLPSEPTYSVANYMGSQPWPKYLIPYNVKESFVLPIFNNFPFHYYLLSLLIRIIFYIFNSLPRGMGSGLEG